MTTMCHAMPEATVLYSVTAVVVLGLVVWLAVVLKTAKQPWTRTVAAAPETGPYRDAAVQEPDVAALAEGTPTSSLDADSTARATPVAIANDGKRPKP